MSLPFATRIPVCTTAAKMLERCLLPCHGGAGSTVIEGTVNERADVTVNGAPAMLRADPANANVYRFSATVPVAAGANTVTISAQDYDSPTRHTTTNAWQFTVPALSRSFAYDDNGNTLIDGQRTLTWDAKNRLRTVTKSGTTWKWDYDYSDRRVREYSKTGSATTFTLNKVFIWDGDDIIQERDSAGAITRTHYAGGFVDGANPATGTKYQTLADHLGNVREVVNAAGTIAARYDYTPYEGPVPVGTPTVAPTFLTIGRYYHHAGSGLEMAEHRAYDAVLGRWLSRDPIEEDGGTNLYGYVFNNPIGLIDPLGLDTDIIVHRNSPVAGEQARDASGTMSVFHDGRFQFSCRVNNFGYQDGTHGIYPRTYSVKPRTDADKTSHFDNGTPAVTAPGESNPGDAGSGYHNVYIHPESNAEGGDSRGCLTVPRAAADRVKQLMDADQKAKQPTTLKVYNYGRAPSATPVR